jgi:hypothetical protein
MEASALPQCRPAREYAFAKMKGRKTKFYSGKDLISERCFSLRNNCRLSHDAAKFSCKFAKK